MEYAFATAIIDKIVREHCNAILVRGELHHDELTPKAAQREVEVIKNAYDKVRNG
jgi:hypothetical protein